MSSLKKSDIKKQRQMNSLKNELVKKERVLGHKDRELGRINSKLRACEEHITQLLKIQNRNRQKIGISSKNEGVDMRSGLSESELEHLTTSKTMLDNLVADRVEKKRARMLFNMKTSVLNDLNKELVQEAVDLEELMAKKKGLVESITAVYAAFDSDEFDLDATSYLASLQASSDPAVDIASYASDLIEVSKSVLIVENNIDRITRELDFYNADLDDLANLLDKSKDKKDSWEELGKEIIAGISLSQFRPLIWDLLSEKANQAEQLSSAHEALRTATENVTSASDKVLELEKQLNAVKQQMKEGLEKAELQRVSDMWALIKAHNTPADGGDKSPGNATGGESSLALQVSICRANELEKLLEASLQSEEESKEQNSALNSKLVEVENQLANQVLRSKMSASSTSSSTAVSSQCIDKLVSVWDKLGVAGASRTEIVDSITNASEIASIKAVERYEDEHAQVLQQIQYLRETLDLFNRVACSGDAPTHADACSESLLLPQLAHYRNEVSRRQAEIIAKKDAMVVIKEKLLDLLAEMWIEISDLPLSLQSLMKLSLDKVCVEDNESVIALAHQVLDVDIVLTDSIVFAWNNEIKKLNVLRANNTNKLVTLRSNCVSLAQALGVHDKQSLNGALGANGNESTSSMVVNLMLSSSSANPPGASQLVTMFECMQSVLNVLKSNRNTVHELLFRFVETINGQIQDGVTYRIKEGFEVFSREEVADLLSHTTNINARSLQVREQLQHRLTMLSRDCKIDLIANTKSVAEGSHVAAAVDELCAIAELVEEEWITKTLTSFLALYQQQTSEHLSQVLYLRTEVGRYTVINDSIVEITRLDNLLTKHVVEMEEFEASSKQNRVALLTGNSKALVEEEKFRKNGKKKYEVLSEKIISAHVSLLRAVGSLNGLPSGVVPGIDLTHLSSQTVALLKGKAQEKIELMHLHTTTHGTKRWSGDKDDVTQENPEFSEGKEGNSTAASAAPAIPAVTTTSVLPAPPAATTVSRIAKPASKTSSNLSATLAAASNAIKATETITKASTTSSAAPKNAVATSMMKNVSSLFSQRGKTASKDENSENKSVLSNK